MKFLLQIIRDCWLAGMNDNEVAEYLAQLCARPSVVKIVSNDPEFMKLETNTITRNILYHFSQLDEQMKSPAHLVK